MRIDIHNYEAFFLDYKEGNLDEGQVKELFGFLEEYPQLKAELDSFEPLVLEMEVSFIDKSIFKKNDLSDEALIAYTENIIDEKGRREVEGLSAQNVALAMELLLYKKTIVVADETIKFPRKSRLKRGGVVIYLQSNPAYMRVAAALLLLLGLFFLVAKLNTNDASGSAAPKLAVEDNKNKNEATAVKKEVSAPGQEEKDLASNDHPKKEIAPAQNNVQPKYAIKKGPGEPKNEAPVISNTLTVSTNTVLANNESDRKEERDSLAVAQVVPEGKATYRSYYNYSSEEDEKEVAEEKAEITASAASGKKTFFQKITNAAKKVNGLGVKKVDGEEDNGTRSLSIGGFVLSETVSN